MTEAAKAVMDRVLVLVRLSLWGGDPAGLSVDEAVYAELKRHTILALPAGLMGRLAMPDDLRRAWKLAMMQQVAFYVQCQRAQAELPVTAPYALLKGSEAARYYPDAKLRAMGDIDIMPRREDFAAVCDMLLNGGYMEVPDDDADHATGRHRQFRKGQVFVEVHAYYAHTNDLKKAEVIDGLILSRMRPDHTLPDEVNGIVLLDHINHHMESGLGLRQVIDWMMFADRRLSDAQWPAFRDLARQTGHDRLAVAVTRMCEIYLGLPKRAWTAGADPALCERLMAYVMDSGNFGRRTETDSWTSVDFLSNLRSLKGTVAVLQRRGLENWPAARRHRLLRPFAWIYQAGRYLRKGLGRDHSIARFRSEYEDSRRWNDLCEALGVPRASSGLVRYRNGKYVREKRTD